MLKVTIPKENILICNKLEEFLSVFPLSKDSDRIQVITKDDNIYVAYLTDSNSRLKQTFFDLQIKDNVCDILGFGITKEYKLKGHGRSLYNVVEKFSSFLNCKSIITVSSGEGNLFWPKMGFVNYSSNSTKSQKVL